MLEDDFYFDKDDKLLNYVENDEPDRVFVATGETKMDEETQMPVPELNQVEMTSEEIEQKMNENGYKKVPKTVLNETITMTSKTDSKPPASVTSETITEVVESHKYTEKSNQEIDSKLIPPALKFEPPIDVGSSEYVSRREIIYGNKSTGRKIAEGYSKINDIGSGKLTTKPVRIRYPSYDALPKNKEYLKQFKKD